MRIAFVYSRFTIGGIETNILETSKYLRKLGHKCYIVTPKGFFTDLSIRFESNEPSFREYVTKEIAALPRTVARLRALELDIINVHSYWTYPFTNSLLILGRRVAKRVVVTPHLNLEERYRLIQKLPFTQRSVLYLYHRYFGPQVLKMADAIIARSQTEYKMYNDLKAHNIFIIPNGIDTDVFCPSEKEKNNLVLFVGRIYPLKGLHILLRSLSFLRKPTHLIIIGPPGPESAYFENILSSINKINEKTSHTVTYFGPLEREETIRWYRRASALIRPDIDGFSGGLTSLEALACGTPVIGTGNDVIKDGVNGILVPPNDAEKLADAIQYLLSNPDRGSRLGKNGRRMILTHFSMDVLARKLCEVYGSVLSR